MASSEFIDRISRLSQKQLALLTLELQQKLERQSQAAGPVAVVGMACRFPGGATTPEAYWELLKQGRDAICEIPPERWDVNAYYDPDPDAPGKIATRWGGFLDQVDQFDPDFFGIAPREAINMDPQQRLVLEVAWEAFERAGVAPDTLEKSRTGVFLGICNSDYFQLNASGDARRIDAYLASGSAASVASGRLSYLLGLQGPSISIDTACSSSLVAVHLACQSLRSGESKIAIAGGVNVILRPEVTMTLSRAHMMASDGRCKAFDSRADGFVRAEGCGLVVLKRLADAQADGDRILAVIRASASNQDGRSSGITAPNGPSQEGVIRDALSAAGLKPSDIDYVEAHGTGTALGDPIEIQALAASLGPGRDEENPLLVGSAKTNIGHLESAAGIAGLIKVILALQHRLIPPHLHLRELNPHVDWSSMPVEIPTRLTPWRSRGTRLAGVSSFGFSGTNAHLIIEEAPRSNERLGTAQADASAFLLPLSARSERALRELAKRLAQFLVAHPEEDCSAVSAAMGVGRAHFEHRAAIVAKDRRTCIEALEAAAAGELRSGVVRGAAHDLPEIAFLFTGQGSQYVGMGRALYAAEPVFRHVIDECESALTGTLDRPLKEILFGADRTQLSQTAYLQPALFALEVAIAALWRSWGVTPSAVLGHSVGEYSAACVAGMFSVGDGARLVSARGRLMQAAHGDGRMIAVEADETTVREVLRGRNGVGIGAINAPNQTVVSGYAKQVEEVARELSARGCTVHALEVSHAFHSAQMDSMLREFEQHARAVKYDTPQIALVSNVTGESWTDGSYVSDPAAYWTRHVREAVQFRRGMQTLEKLKPSIYVEIGPNPVLLNMGRTCIASEGAEWLPSLRAGMDEREQLLQSAARLYVHGAQVDWRALTQGAARNVQHALPTYPFQRRRFWISPGAGMKGTQVLSPAAPSLPALTRLDTATPTFETVLDLERVSYLDQHRIGGRAVAPGALMLQMLRDAGRSYFGSEDVTVEEVSFREMLAIPEEAALRVQIVLTECTSSTAAAAIYSRQLESSDVSWSQHVTAKVAPASREVPHAPLTLASAQQQCREPESRDAFYARLEESGLAFGPLFRGVIELRSGAHGVLGRVRLPDELRSDHVGDAHPVLLDACLQLLGVAVTRRGLDETYMQVTLGRMHFTRPLGTELWGYAELRQTVSGGELSGDVYLFDDEGALIGVLEDIGLKRIPLALLSDSAATIPHPQWLYEIAWRRAAHANAGWLLPELNSLVGSLRSAVEPLSVEHGLDAFADLSPQMEHASALFIARALEKMDCRLQPGTRVSTDVLRRDLRVLPSFERLFVRMLAILEEEGVLRRSAADDWMVVTALPTGDGAAECRRLLSTYPSYRAELTLLSRCGERLAEVLQGSQDPLQLLFPEGDPAALEGLYRDSPSARVFNRIVQSAVVDLAEHREAGQVLRVLEIGGGTASTTQYVLPVLPPETEYVFTDISPLFVARAAEKFSSRAGMQFVVFDVDDKEPLEQGLTPGSFDMIIAANVLHATRDLRRTMSRVRELLRPGGVLVLLEGTRPLRWVDLTFGMTEGWWRFTDRELRPQHALLAPTQWRALLESSGFDQTAAAPENVEAAGQTVLLARAALAGRAAIAGDKPKWLICTHDIQRGREAALACSLAGIEVRLAATSGTDAQSRAGEYALRGSGSADVASLLTQLKTSGFQPSALVLVAAEHPADDPIETASKDCLLATASLKALVDGNERLRLWIVTRGAQNVSAQSLHFEQAALWGWGRVASLEQPEHFGALLDLDPEAVGFDAAALRSAIDSASSEDQIAIRQGEPRVPRLVRADTPPVARFHWRGDAAYVVTGWMGGLGLLIVQWLFERGARHFVLIGRRDPESGGANCDKARGVLRQLRAQGASSTVVVGDVADATFMGQLFDRFGRDLPQLAGVLHAAAHLDSRAITELDQSALREMMHSKASGAWLLHQLTKQANLDCFVLFSSTTALWGAQGLAHYAAANQILDGLAHRRRAMGLPALSVNWGTWAAMRLASDEARELYASAGLEPMSAPGALAMLDAMLGADASQITIAAVDWDRLKPVYEARRARPIFSEIGAAGAASERRPKQRETNMAEAWSFENVPDNERKEVLAERVRTEVATVLGLGNAAEVDPARGLFDLGMDSLMAVELRARLQKRAGCALPSTLTFNYPNAAALTQFLERLLFVMPTNNITNTTAGSSGAHTTTVTATTGPTAAEREELSEDELEQLLADRLRML